MRTGETVALEGGGVSGGRRYAFAMCAAGAVLRELCARCSIRVVAPVASTKLRLTALARPETHRTATREPAFSVHTNAAISARRLCRRALVHVDAATASLWRRVAQLTGARVIPSGARVPVEIGLLACAHATGVHDARIRELALVTYTDHISRC